MLHVEQFNSNVHPEKMAKFFQEKALPYWRKNGHNVRFYMTQYALGTAQFWLITEVDEIDDFEKWPERSLGDEEGRKIMEELMSMQESYPKASLIKNIEEDMDFV